VKEGKTGISRQADRQTRWNSERFKEGMKEGEKGRKEGRKNNQVTFRSNPSK
jgi:hypothetical protein